MKDITKKLMFILSLGLCCGIGFAQHAEKLYKEDFAKIGLELSTDILFTHNTAHPLLFEYASTRTLNAGLTYNFYQRQDLNVRLSGIFSTFVINEKDKMPLGDGRVNRGYEGGDNNMLIRMPLEIEYFFQLTTKTYFSVFTGVELMYNVYGDDEGYVLFEQNPNNQSSIVPISVHEYARTRILPLYMGVNFGMTYSLPTKAMLLQFSAKYHFYPNDYIYERVEITAVNGIDQISKQSVTGSYFGFGLRITPNKFWFK